MKIIQTVAIIQKGDEILLGMKKRGFGAGRWNGFGGKLKENENVIQAAQRELKEETGIDTENLIEMGIIEFEFKRNPDILEVHFLKGTDFSGALVETEEMKPAWFKINEIPYDSMWPDDKFWLPLFLEGKKFCGKFLFDNYNKIIKHKLEIVDKLQ
ncbi:MAG: 8-oxo-dGTP diphosphatase [Candidatus Moranbacteria bacterium]|nr:8-oxo-dGTP diphosphatase [Candidatus Moranbacteria bacterium]